MERLGHVKASPVACWDGIFGHNTPNPSRIHRQQISEYLRVVVLEPPPWKLKRVSLTSSQGAIKLMGTVENAVFVC